MEQTSICTLDTKKLCTTEPYKQIGVYITFLMIVVCIIFYFVNISFQERKQIFLEKERKKGIASLKEFVMNINDESDSTDHEDDVMRMSSFI